MNILCLFLAIFTLSRFNYIFSITLKHERKTVSVQVQYRPLLKRWDNFDCHFIISNLPTFSSKMTMSGQIKVKLILWV